MMPAERAMSECGASRHCETRENRGHATERSQQERPVTRRAQFARNRAARERETCPVACGRAEHECERKMRRRTVDLHPNSSLHRAAFSSAARERRIDDSEHRVTLNIRNARQSEEGPEL